MKRLQLQRWTGLFPGALPCRTCAARGAPAARSTAHQPERSRQLSRRCQSTAAASAAPEVTYEDPPHFDDHHLASNEDVSRSYPSPLPERALHSPKLAALHARLSLSDKLPLQTLARALVDPSADASPRFNNASLAFLGGTLINYHTTEWLLCRYPRLPMAIVYAAMDAFADSRPLHEVARQWGVESAAVPGGEVDPGLLQYSMRKPQVVFSRLGYQRVEAAYLEKFKWRRGMSSRVVLDDDFGNTVERQPTKEEQQAEEAAAEATAADQDDVNQPQTLWPTEENRQAAVRAHGNFVRAVVAAIYAHCGREPAKAFVQAHILSRTLDLSALFSFKLPTRELALLCAREKFESPVARLLSETGRLSRTPVFVVGIYSGKDKLGEAASWSLDSARSKAAINALKAWYLYSPGQHVRVPSDMLLDGARPWEPAHIDIGEII